MENSITTSTHHGVRHRWTFCICNKEKRNDSKRQNTYHTQVSCTGYCNKVIIWATVDPDLYQHMVLLGHRISNHILSKVWNDISYPNVNGCTVEVYKWVNDFIPCFNSGCNFLSMLGSKLTILVKDIPEYNINKVYLISPDFFFRSSWAGVQSGVIDASWRFLNNGFTWSVSYSRTVVTGDGFPFSVVILNILKNKDFFKRKRGWKISILPLAVVGFWNANTRGLHKSFWRQRPINYFYSGGYLLNRQFP